MKEQSSAGGIRTSDQKGLKSQADRMDLNGLSGREDFRAPIGGADRALTNQPETGRWGRPISEDEEPVDETGRLSGESAEDFTSRTGRKVEGNDEFQGKKNSEGYTADDNLTGMAGYSGSDDLRSRGSVT